MSEKFKPVIIDNQNDKFSRDIKEIDTSHLKDGNVLVKVDYSSLNFKDAMILNVNVLKYFQHPLQHNPLQLKL